VCDIGGYIHDPLQNGDELLELIELSLDELLEEQWLHSDCGA
jgi:hypothetical protein